MTFFSVKCEVSTVFFLPLLSVRAIKNLNTRGGHETMLPIGVLNLFSSSVGQSACVRGFDAFYPELESFSQLHHDLSATGLKSAQ